MARGRGRRPASRAAAGLFGFRRRRPLSNLPKAAGRRAALSAALREISPRPDSRRVTSTGDLTPPRGGGATVSQLTIVALWEKIGYDTDVVVHTRAERFRPGERVSRSSTVAGRAGGRPGSLVWPAHVRIRGAAASVSFRWPAILPPFGCTETALQPAKLRIQKDWGRSAAAGLRSSSAHCLMPTRRTPPSGDVPREWKRARFGRRAGRFPVPACCWMVSA